MRTFQMLTGIVMGLLFAGSAVLAGVADDFKDAANRDGCEAIGERCVANRIAVQKVFANVKSKVQSESDQEAKQYVSKLVDKYTAAEKGHQEAIDITKRGIEKCKNVR